MCLARRAWQYVDDSRDAFFWCAHKRWTSFWHDSRSTDNQNRVACRKRIAYARTVPSSECNDESTAGTRIAWVRSRDRRIVRQTDLPSRYAYDSTYLKQSYNQIRQCFSTFVRPQSRFSFLLLIFSWLLLILSRLLLLFCQNKHMRNYMRNNIHGAFELKNCFFFIRA